MPIKNDKNKEIISTRGLWAGDPDAPVSMVFYGDYESEACAKVHRVIVKLLEGKKVRLNYRHFPLTLIHQHAHKAA